MEAVSGEEVVEEVVLVVGTTEVTPVLAEATGQVGVGSLDQADGCQSTDIRIQRVPCVPFAPPHRWFFVQT